MSQIAVFPTPIQRQEEDGEELQMKAEGGPAARPDVPVASGGGSPLSAPVLGKMERSFGHSFSDVRVHHGEEAKQVGALAYTRGSDIHFQPGLYDPDSMGGQELLGHELTHVIQQKAGRVSAPQSKASGTAPINADTGLESEADTMGARAARGQAALVSGAAGGGLQRKAASAPIQRQDDASAAVLPPPISQATSLPPLLPLPPTLALPPPLPTTTPPPRPARPVRPLPPVPTQAPPVPTQAPPPAPVLNTPPMLSNTVPAPLPVPAAPVLNTPPLPVPAATTPAVPTLAPVTPAPITLAPAEDSPWYVPGRKYEAANNILNTDLANQVASSAQAVQHSSLADLNIGGLMSDNAAAGINVGGVLGLPGNFLGGVRGAKNLYGGLKKGDDGRDWHRAFEGAAELGGNIVQGGNTVLNAVSGAGSLSNALNISAAATAPVGLGVSAMMTAKNIYQMGMAQHHRSALGDVAADPANDPALQEAAEHARLTQTKRLNRAALNTTANGLMVAGAATTIGTGYTGVGAGVGAGLAASGAALKGGAWGFRKMKQSSRDAAARREEEKLANPGQKLGLWDRTIGRASDAVFKPNTEKTTAKKEQKYDEHTATILGNASAGKDIFSHLGANKSDLSLFEKYHDGATPATEKAELEATLKARIKEQFKYRGE